MLARDELPSREERVAKGGRDAVVTTRTGDEGYTGLLGSERVPKWDARVEACGEIDEASSAIGVARASVDDPAIARLLLSTQRDLYVLMSEVVATPEVTDRLARRIVGADVARLEGYQADYADRVEIGREFIVPGGTRDGAALDLARAVVRRAERRTVRIAHASQISNADLLSYLNRLSDLLFVLARFVERPTGSAGATGSDLVAEPNASQTAERPTESD